MTKTLELLVLAYEKNSLDAIINHLYEMGLSHHCKITGVTEVEMSGIYTPDLILTTSKIVYDTGKKHFEANTPYIVAKRSINFANIKELLTLPKGSRVYLVNNMKDAATETINTLLEVGIVHDYIPYFGEGEVDPTIKTAITPGEAEMVPESISKIIDIGNRLLDMSTLYEIYQFYGIPTFNFNNQLTARYFHSIVSLTKSLNQEINQSQGLQKSLEGIVNRIDEGLIVYDQSNQIISINNQALEILDKDNLQLISEDISEIPEPFYKVFMKVEMEKENFIDINDISFYIRKKRIFVGTKMFATIILFDKFNRIKNIERKYYKNMKIKGFFAKHTFSDIKTNSGKVYEQLDKAKKMAKSDSTIFIYGETGTGKEVMAQSIHSASNRNEGPFVPVNLAAIPESLAESELFGYEKGAFTGANEKGNVGLFERAHQGTIFLDEIGDASPVIQNRLLRVLQEKEIQRVGGGHPIPIDVRVIAATNKDLKRLINVGKFRDDLYYRLNILPLPLIPLRQRKEDILLLCELFIKEFEEKLHRASIIISNEAKEAILAYDWPGNVRELRNAIEYIAHVSDKEVTYDDLPSYIKEAELSSLTSPPEEIIHFQTLQEKGFLKDSEAILSQLETIGLAIGRRRLLKALEQKEFFLTDQKLRYRLELLSEMNFITVGQGRTGTSINQKGKEFLSYIKKQLKSV